MTRSDLDPEDDGDRREIVHWYPRRRHVQVGAVDARSLALLALGATAFAATAVGVLAVGAMAIGKLGVRRAHFRDLQIDRLTVGSLKVLRP